MAVPPAIVVTRASTWRDDPELAWRYPFHVQRLENLDIPTFPLINLWEGEDDQVPSLKATADELGFRTPIIGNLFRDGGEALAPQLDGFVDALQNGSMPAEPYSHKGMALTENAKWVAENAYGVPGRARDLQAGLHRVRVRGHGTVPERRHLAGRSGVRGGQVPGDHDRQRPCPRRRAHRDPEEGRGAMPVPVWSTST